jgi:hypothetical protein
VSESSSLNPEKIVTTLARFDVKYVLVGALAARLQGFPRLTSDADITPAVDYNNLENLANALQKLKARVFTESVPEGLPFDCSAQNLKQAKRWNLVTAAGRLNIVFKPAGTNGYDDLIADAKRFEAFGTTLFASSIPDIIRSKKSSDRTQDRQDIIILKEMLNRDK